MGTAVSFEFTPVDKRKIKVCEETPSVTERSEKCFRGVSSLGVSEKLCGKLTRLNSGRM